jgi:hypothetical protein
MSGPTKVAETSFEAAIVLEYSALPTAEPLGTLRSTLTLYLTVDDRGVPWYSVEWDVPSLGETVEIGIWVAAGTRRVTDYDGVFSLPREIGRFLQAQGFDLSELYDSQPELREAPA